MYRLRQIVQTRFMQPEPRHFETIHPDSPEGFQYNEFDYFEPKTTVLKKALPWVITSVVCGLALMAVLLGLIYGNGLDQSVTPTSTPALTTTYSILATVGTCVKQFLLKLL